MMLYVAEYNRRCNCFRIDSLDEVVVKNRQAILAYEPLEWVSIGYSELMADMWPVKKELWT